MTNTNMAGGGEVTATSFLTLNYRIALPEGGDVVNTFEDKPATLMMGTGQFAPTLEQALLGMKLGERKTFTLDPEAAFGVKNPDLIRKIDRASDFIEPLTLSQTKYSSATCSIRPPYET